MKLSVLIIFFTMLFSAYSNANIRYWKLVISERSDRNSILETVWFKTVEKSKDRKITTTVLVNSMNGSFMSHFPNINGHKIESLISGEYCNLCVNGHQMVSSVGDGNIILNSIASTPHNFLSQSLKHPQFLVPLFPLVQSSPLSIFSVSLEASGLYTFHFGHRDSDEFSCLWCQTFINEEQQRRWIYHWANRDFGYSLYEISESEIN